MDPFAIFRPYAAFNADDGGGGGGGGTATATEAANARIDAAVADGLRDDGDDADGRVDDPTAGVPNAAGTPAAPAAPPAAPAPAASDDDPLAGIDFENLNYRDGKRIEQELRTQRERFKPFEQAFKGTPDEDRQAAVEGLSSLGGEAAPVIALVGSMNPNDRNVLLDAYVTYTRDPVAGREKFQAIVDAIADPSGTGTPPAGGGAPAGAPAPGAAPTAPGTGAADGTDDLDRPMSVREFEARQQEQQAAVEQERLVAEWQQTMTTQATELGYAPNSTDEAEVDRFHELMGLVATRTNGDVKAADAVIKARDQRIIDGYVKAKKADASRPGTPETGTASSGQTDGNQLPPMEKARARLDAEFGPDRHARQS